ncbi:MAG: hypothetical protein M3499_08050 [Actinomycetota bacterium]|nr:hypothetical protein [Actinomycetota bacterium]
MPDLSWVDWGNAPSWGALIAAVTAAGFAGRNVLVDVRDRQRAQAGQVAAWWGKSRLGDPGLGSLPPGKREFPGAWVRNASEVPVYGVEVVWLYAGKRHKSKTVRVLPPNDEPEFHAMPLDRDPQSPWHDLSVEEQVQALLDVASGGMDVEVSFRDSENRRWLRSPSGALTLVKQL